MIYDYFVRDIRILAIEHLLRCFSPTQEWIDHATHLIAVITGTKSSSVVLIPLKEDKKEGSNEVYITDITDAIKNLKHNICLDIRKKVEENNKGLMEKYKAQQMRLIEETVDNIIKVGEDSNG